MQTWQTEQNNGKAAGVRGLVVAGTRYVHLCSGDIVEISPVTAIEVTADSVLVLNGSEVVRTYPRSEIYFLSDVPMEPPSLN